MTEAGHRGDSWGGLQKMETRIDDDALVVRGGRNQPADIERGTGVHPSGVTGVSVDCEKSLSLTELCAYIPHNKVGVTTVGKVRHSGGDVIRTSGRSPYHATLTGLNPFQASALLAPAVPNPAKSRV